MPKAPRANAKTGRRGKSAGGSGASKSGSGNGAKRPQRAAAAKRKNSGSRKSQAATALAEPSFARRSVDQAAEHAHAGPKARLTEDQRILLGDLFAVVEEHSSDAAEKVDKRSVQKAF